MWFTALLQGGAVQSNAAPNTASLIGTAITASPGTVSVQINNTLIGRTTSSSTGSLGININVALVGQSATLTAGVIQTNSGNPPSLMLNRRRRALLSVWMLGH